MRRGPDGIYVIDIGGFRGTGRPQFSRRIAISYMSPGAPEAVHLDHARRRRNRKSKIGKGIVGRAVEPGRRAACRN
jgi:hypothetical protein